MQNRIKSRSDIERQARIRELLQGKKPDSSIKNNGWDDLDHPSYSNLKL
jgi:hypothetical protein